MKLAIIGGASARTPGIYEQLHERAGRLDIDELVLHDLDGDRLRRIETVLTGIDESRGESLPRRSSVDLRDAVEGADFVYCSIRVGGLEGRLIDESVPLSEGVVGQETTGPGGICFALRSVPAVVSVASEIAEHAPNAWLINFTNPAGLVTEAARSVLGDRVVGICDAPPDLCRRLAAALDRPVEELWFHYFGLNHLAWVSAILDRGRDRLPELLADDERIARTEEGRLFGARWLRTLGLWPNEYLYYYYSTPEVIESMRSGGSRSRFLVGQQSEFYAGDGSPAEALAQWRSVTQERESTYMEEAWEAADLDAATMVAARETNGPSSYGEVALNVLEGVLDPRPRIAILNTANRGSVGGLDDDAVVEVPCIVHASGIHPLAVGDPPPEVRGLIETVKEVERLTIDAALQGSRELALKAMALHPLVPSVQTAERILDGYLERHPQLLGGAM